MNDVLNSHGYTQAACWNRIPIAAWGLMGMIALFANALVGFGASDAKLQPLAFSKTVKRPRNGGVNKAES
ncbi:MAG TPA: hypothetical protein VGH22_10930 [Candidatus Binatia bacterium]